LTGIIRVFLSPRKEVDSTGTPEITMFFCFGERVIDES
jgi:hypothetical protein